MPLCAMPVALWKVPTSSTSTCLRSFFRIRFQEEIGNIAGERIIDNGHSPWVGRGLHGLHTIVIVYRNGTQTYITSNMTAATEAVRFHDSRPDLAWEHPEAVRLLRLRHRVPFQLGELLIQVETYTPPEDAQIATAASRNRIGLLCAAMRFITTTGRVVQVGEVQNAISYFLC